MKLISKETLYSRDINEYTYRKIIMTTLIFNLSKRNGKASQRTNANKRKDQKPRLRSTWASRAGAGRPLQGSRGLALQGLAGGACPSASCLSASSASKALRNRPGLRRRFHPSCYSLFFYSSFHPFIRTSSAFLRLSIYAASFETPVAVTLVHQLLMLMDRASPQVITNSSHSCWVADPSCARPGAPFASG